ncbi:riboflavin synthase, partial [Francisella tularensis subsp. holarctica]|nr:riboflavin synthase [Francisella tularensis subsp. holarctica]
TVINVHKDSYTVTLIPHTIEVPISKNYSNCTMVNLEAEATGKYIYKYIQLFKENV